LEQFNFKNHPIIISPYDDIVDKAYHEISPKPEVDVIKLESTCTGDRAAWVNNQDLLQGKPGQQRIIHLCLKRIKDEFQKKFGKPFVVTNPQQKNQIKDIIKEYLKNIVIPHETKHIEQEIEHGGKFPATAEPEAERAEKRKEFEMKSVFSNISIIKKLDEIADKLESAGLIKHAYALDIVCGGLQENVYDRYTKIKEKGTKTKDEEYEEYFLGKLVSEAHQHGINNPIEIDRYMRKALEKSLGPYATSTGPLI
jgi:hypothetical protein